MTFFVESLGCAKNQVDSEELIAHLERGGLGWAETAEEADLIIVNTCGFITSAKEESIQTSLSFKDRFPGKRVLMTGCLVQRYGPQLAAAMEEIDGFAPLRDFEAVLRLARDSGAAEGTDRPAGEGSARRSLAGPRRGQPAGGSSRGRHLLSFPGSAYVKVADGCGNRCSYCAIPLIRGELVSRPQAEIVEEIRGLLAQGVYELILIAQDLASYGRDRAGGRAPGELVRLVEAICRLPDPFWLRLLYLHPDYFPPGLLELVASEPRVLPYFDLPFQHASRSVLAGMGRKGSAAAYLELVERIRESLPQAALRSTFLVGFPGETEEDFQALGDFQAAARLDWLGVFAYSREEGTPACDLPGRVPLRVAKERKRLLEQAQLPITWQRLEGHLGRELEVLVEEAVQGEDTPLALARCYLQAPEVDGLMVVRAPRGAEGQLRPGQRCRVRVERRAGVDLEASLAAAP
jgi:ribosomal protein S12 methylthiotransferase